MNFGANITPVEVIKKGTFGGTYFRDMYSSVISKWYKNSWKEFDGLKDTSLRFWEDKRWINPIDPYGWFQWYFR